MRTACIAWRQHFRLVLFYHFLSFCSFFRRASFHSSLFWFKLNSLQRIFKRWVIFFSSSLVSAWKCFKYCMNLFLWIECVCVYGNLTNNNFNCRASENRFLAYSTSSKTNECVRYINKTNIDSIFSVRTSSIHKWKETENNS